jgi:hypothetical protein
MFFTATLSTITAIIISGKMPALKSRKSIKQKLENGDKSLIYITWSDIFYYALLILAISIFLISQNNHDSNVIPSQTQNLTNENNSSTEINKKSTTALTENNKIRQLINTEVILSWIMYLYYRVIGIIIIFALIAVSTAHEQHVKKVVKQQELEVISILN